MAKGSPSDAGRGTGRQRLVVAAGAAVSVAILVIAWLASPWVRGGLTAAWAFLGDARDVLNGLLAPFAGLLPFLSFPAGPLQGLGDVALLASLFVVLVWLLRGRESEATRRIGELRMQEKVTEELSRQAAEKANPHPEPLADAAGPADRLQLSASAVVALPPRQVWDTLRGAVLVPTCQELLESVEVVEEAPGVLTWEGTLRIDGGRFDAAGTTTLRPPTAMEVQGTRGALRGFRGGLTLSEVSGGTKLSMTAELDPSVTRATCPPVLEIFARRGTEILMYDLDHFEWLLEALGPSPA